MGRQFCFVEREREKGGGGGEGRGEARENLKIARES